ncbi:hypothetical protein H072_6073 [Dactylellina haptotyla CBS 200.50]|uniref:Uncharacterized protein n=1 Tax=Dactylellina haptotyla (strain CBS 200.50) TaxID=1284197 RepID=S8AB42_DACHA|nr:hypothetical protein H072_6073 [Dactylellina haptotyla CBS 200.50]
MTQAPPSRTSTFLHHLSNPPRPLLYRSYRSTSLAVPDIIITPPTPTRDIEASPSPPQTKYLVKHHLHRKTLYAYATFLTSFTAAFAICTTFLFTRNNPKLPLSLLCLIFSAFTVSWSIICTASAHRLKLFREKVESKYEELLPRSSRIYRYTLESVGFYLCIMLASLVAFVGVVVDVLPLTRAL